MFETPTAWLGAWWLLWVGQAAWCLYNVNLYLRRMRKQGQFATEDQVQFCPPAVVIVPVKGTTAAFEQHVGALLTQDYPKYRVIFCVESEEDEAFAALHRLDARWQGRYEVVVAGLAQGEGQKIHNQRAGLARLRIDDGAVVFADADAVPDEHWLGRLVFPLYKGAVGATTGYRWFVPGDDRLPSRLASVVNSSIATLMGPDRRNFAWGGSMAIRRDTLDAIELDKHWRGALSDDYQMTRAVARHGRRLYFVMRLLIPSPARYDWRSLLAFGRRQYLITRIHAPVIWLIGLIGSVIYLGAMLGAIGTIAAANTGWGWAMLAILFVHLLDQLRASRRTAISRALFDQPTCLALRGAARLDRWATPLVMLVHLAMILASALGRTIHWAGVTYRLHGRQNIQIISRQPTGPHSPAPTPG